MKVRASWSLKRVRRFEWRGHWPELALRSHKCYLDRSVRLWRLQAFLISRQAPLMRPKLIADGNDLQNSIGAASRSSLPGMPCAGPIRLQSRGLRLGAGLGRDGDRVGAESGEGVCSWLSRPTPFTMGRCRRRSGSPITYLANCILGAAAFRSTRVSNRRRRGVDRRALVRLRPHEYRSENWCRWRVSNPHGLAPNKF
jgi:hypothetical protein